ALRIIIFASARRIGRQRELFAFAAQRVTHFSCRCFDLLFLTPTMGCPWVSMIGQRHPVQLPGLSIRMNFASASPSDRAVALLSFEATLGRDLPVPQPLRRKLLGSFASLEEAIHALTPEERSWLKQAVVKWDREGILVGPLHARELCEFLDAA